MNSEKDWFHARLKKEASQLKFIFHYLQKRCKIALKRSLCYQCRKSDTLIVRFTSRPPLVNTTVTPLFLKWSATKKWVKPSKLGSMHIFAPLCSFYLWRAVHCQCQFAFWHEIVVGAEVVVVDWYHMIAIIMINHCCSRCWWRSLGASRRRWQQLEASNFARTYQCNCIFGRPSGAAMSGVRKTQSNGALVFQARRRVTESRSQFPSA